MNDVEEQILSYPHLPVEEQREIEAYVESNPEWARLLRDVRSIEHLSTSVQVGLPSDALLATYVVGQHLHPDEASPEMQAAFSKLEARIEEDESLRREVEAARRRLEEAEAAIDPVSHFEALTGHELAKEAEAEVEPTEASASESDEARPSAASVLEVFASLPLLVRRGVAVAVVLVGLYGGLYGVSRATQSTLDRLAVMEVSSQVVGNYASVEMRSANPEADTMSVDDQYLDALSILQEARVSTLGLFPRYDPKALAQAEEQLNQVVEQVEPGSFLALEARFYLGKIALAQEEVDAARGHFKTVVKRKGRRAQQAYDILKTLQQEQVADGQ